MASGGQTQQDAAFFSLAVKDTLVAQNRFTAREADIGNLFVSGTTSLLHVDVAGSVTVSGDIVSGGNVQGQTASFTTATIDNLVGPVEVNTGALAATAGLSTNSALASTLSGRGMLEIDRSKGKMDSNGF